MFSNSFAITLFSGFFVCVFWFAISSQWTMLCLGLSLISLLHGKAPYLANPEQNLLPFSLTSIILFSFKSGQNECYTLEHHFCFIFPMCFKINGIINTVSILVWSSPYDCLFFPV